MIWPTDEVKKIILPHATSSYRELDLIKSITKFKFIYRTFSNISMTSIQLVECGIKHKSRAMSHEIHDCPCGNDLCETRRYVLGIDIENDSCDTLTMSSIHCRACKRLLYIDNKIFNFKVQTDAD